MGVFSPDYSGRNAWSFSSEAQQIEVISTRPELKISVIKKNLHFEIDSAILASMNLNFDVEIYLKSKIHDIPLTTLSITKQEFTVHEMTEIFDSEIPSVEICLEILKRGQTENTYSLDFDSSNDISIKVDNAIINQFISPIKFKIQCLKVKEIIIESNQDHKIPKLLCSLKFNQGNKPSNREIILDRDQFLSVCQSHNSASSLEIFELNESELKKPYQSSEKKILPNCIAFIDGFELKDSRIHYRFEKEYAPHPDFDCEKIERLYIVSDYREFIKPVDILEFIKEGKMDDLEEYIPAYQNHGFNSDWIVDPSSPKCYRLCVENEEWCYHTCEKSELPPSNIRINWNLEGFKISTDNKDEISYVIMENEENKDILRIISDEGFRDKFLKFSSETLKSIMEEKNWKNLAAPVSLQIDSEISDREGFPIQIDFIDGEIIPNEINCSVGYELKLEEVYEKLTIIKHYFLNGEKPIHKEELRHEGLESLKREVRGMKVDSLFDSKIPELIKAKITIPHGNTIVLKTERMSENENALIIQSIANEDEEAKKRKGGGRRGKNRRRRPGGNPRRKFRTRAAPTLPPSPDLPEVPRIPVQKQYGDINPDENE